MPFLSFTLSALLLASKTGRVATYHQVQVDVVETQVLERSIDTLRDVLVPGIVQLRGHEDLLARHARGPDALADLGLVAVRICGVDVAVSCAIVSASAIAVPFFQRSSL